ncbi:alginate lyase family protein [Herbidospora cretacea]|uniref:alginate lyase family protein n=1 Tax=Herbidospora cretacea TaxID=28444 RepID=UPI0004C30C2A|nr:alginate lyase family protein [Herbidospora cretacea]
MARSLCALLVLLSALVATPAQAAPAVFAHPGVMVSRAQLDFVKGRVAAGAQPWKAAFDQMAASPFASLTRNPTPRAVVECGSYSNPNIGCTDERQDALAAYTLALRWYITGDARYATKAISIMDAWSAVLRDHTNSNAPLQSAWAASTWPRAAEIIRYTYTGGWPNMQRFATMLREVYLPEVVNGSSSNGNWELSMMEAAIGIAVFLEDRAVYDRAVARFRARAAAFLYVAADGPQPKYPPVGNVDTYAELVSFWHGQTTFVDGLSQETCRDFTHTGYGVSAISHVAETSRIQGQDLYPELADRLRHALGLHAKYQLGAAAPSWLCGGSLKLGLGPVTEVGFNALNTRMGIAMTNTQTLTERQRPAGTNYLFVAWETLTHARNPN